jgi:hypothetical protein
MHRIVQDSTNRRLGGNALGSISNPTRPPHTGPTGRPTEARQCAKYAAASVGEMIERAADFGAGPSDTQIRKA